VELQSFQNTNTESCTLTRHTIVHVKPPRHYDLAFAEGRLTLVVPEGKTTPSNVLVFGPFLVDLTAPTPLLREVLLAFVLRCPTTFSSACSLLAISWYSSMVFSKPFSVTEIRTWIIPSLLRRDRATGMPRSWTIERNVSALRLSHGNVFWLDMWGAGVMVAVLE